MDPSRATDETEERDGAASQTIAVDPVCGVRLERALAPSSTIHRDRKHWFCSDSCKATFLHDPEHYLGLGLDRRNG